MPTYRTHTGEAAWLFDMAGDPQPFVVTLGFKTIDDAFDPEQALTPMITGWMDQLRAITSTGCTLRQTEIHWTDTAGDKVAIHHAGVAGQDAGGKLPQNCALLVQKQTGLAGRKNRGRMYWPAVLSEAWVDNVGVIGTATVADLQTRFNAVYAAITAGDGTAEMAILHHDHSEATGLTGFNVANVIATQRRRLRR